MNGMDWKGIGTGVVGLAIMLVVLTSVFGIFATTGAQGTVKTAIPLDADNTGELELVGLGTGVENVSANQSLGTAAGFTGQANSYAKSGDAISVSDGSEWTVSTWAKLDNTTESQTIVSMQGRLVLYYDGTQWSAFLYRDSGSSYRANVSATDAANWTHLTVSHDNGQMTIYEDNVAGETVSTTERNAVAGTFSAGNLDGSIEETRMWSVALNSSQRQELIDNPTRPASTPADVRIMYDTRAGTATSLPIYGAAGNLQLNNVNIVSGFVGESVDLGTDYQIINSERGVEATSEKLQGNPVIFMTYDEGGLGGLLQKVVNVGGAALSLLVIGLLVWAANEVIDTFGTGGGF